jgi:hypothetical protein
LAARSSASSGDIVGAVGSGMAEVVVRPRGPSMIGSSIYLAFKIVQIFYRTRHVLDILDAAVDF